MKFKPGISFNLSCCKIESLINLHDLCLCLFQAYEVLKLVNQMIPSAAKDLADMQSILAKEKILTDQPSFLCQFSKEILPVFIKVCFVSQNCCRAHVLRLDMCYLLVFTGSQLRVKSIRLLWLCLCCQ